MKHLGNFTCVFLLTLSAVAQERVQRLQFNAATDSSPNSYTRQEIFVSTNEICEILIWRSMGTWSSENPLRFQVENTNGTVFSLSLGDKVLGPATISAAGQLVGPGNVWYKCAFEAILQFRPVNKPLPAALPLPAGSGARVDLETSVDLNTWVPVPTGYFPTAEVNRYFRLKMALAPGTPTNLPPTKQGVLKLNN